MRIRKIRVRELRMMLIGPFETSFGSTTERRVLLVEADVDGISGWGEATVGENPYYSPETVETALHILRDFIWPALRGREFSSAAEIPALLGLIRGPSTYRRSRPAYFFLTNHKPKRPRSACRT